MKSICVIGYPSRIGGADTELDHQIHVWQAMGLEVHLIHTGPLDENLRSMRMEERGCVVHEPCDWAACRGMHVISYCNGEFLKHLDVIRSYAKTTTFVNCMCWLFDAEKDAHRRGLIDCFLYQTDHAREKVQQDLIAINPNFRWFKVRPYFHLADFPFVAERPDDKFRFGRISRDDPGKFHKSQLWVYETMVAPVLKEGVILGINDQIRDKIGREPNWIRGFPAGGLPVQEVYQHAHCIIQMPSTTTAASLRTVAASVSSRSTSTMRPTERDHWSGSGMPAVKAFEDSNTFRHWTHFGAGPRRASNPIKSPLAIASRSGTFTGDAGPSPIRQFDEAIARAQRFADALADARNGDVRHSNRSLTRQRIYGILAPPAEPRLRGLQAAVNDRRSFDWKDRF